jgi:hypothetical protein
LRQHGDDLLAVSSGNSLLFRSADQEWVLGAAASWEFTGADRADGVRAA